MKKRWNSVIVILFPLLSIPFLYSASIFMEEVRKHIYFEWKFFLTYVLYLMLYFLFLYHTIRTIHSVSWVVLGIGMCEILLSHIRNLWKGLPHFLYNGIMALFPYYYFLFGILAVTYVLLIALKRSKSKTDRFSLGEI